MRGTSHAEVRRKAHLERTRVADVEHEHFVKFVMEKLGIEDRITYVLNLNKLTDREIASLVSAYNTWKEAA